MSSLYDKRLTDTKTENRTESYLQGKDNKKKLASQEDMVVKV